MSKGDVKNPATDGRVKNKGSNKRGGHTTPENQRTKQKKSS